MKPLFAAILAGMVGSSALAQVNMQYDGQANGQWSGQYSGQVDPRVDGRASRNEGLPPGAADKGGGIYDNPVNASDCAELQTLNPDARPAMQRRLGRACAQQ
ncbi:MAG: hypothetical protein QOJ42_2769 [Acidobacteriaceae bacterium]|jgi:hypothetical protein|nr:hypothetical protein [Acidobacteriaceae bacterium]